MGLRYQNTEEFPFRFPAINIFGGADITLMRVPFHARVAGFRAILTTVVDANNVDINIERVADDIAMSGTLNFAVGDALGTILGAAGNDIVINRGQEIGLNFVESGAVAAGVADIFLVLRKVEPGVVYDQIPRT